MTCCGDSSFFGCYGNQQVERNSDRYLGQVARRLTDWVTPVNDDAVNDVAAEVPVTTLAVARRR